MQPYIEATRQENENIIKILRKYSITIKNLRVFKNTVGSVNEIFFVVADRKKYILRKSALKISREHIHLEIDVL